MWLCTRDHTGLLLHARRLMVVGCVGRMVAADVNLLRVPDNLPDEKVLLLSDVLPTAWHATELGSVSQGDRVAIWGAGPGERRTSLQCAVAVSYNQEAGSPAAGASRD